LIAAWIDSIVASSTWNGAEAASAGGVLGDSLAAGGSPLVQLVSAIAAEQSAARAGHEFRKERLWFSFTTTLPRAARDSLGSC
jgi:hypothetical protein